MSTHIYNLDLEIDDFTIFVRVNDLGLGLGQASSALIGYWYIVRPLKRVS